MSAPSLGSPAPGRAETDRSKQHARTISRWFWTFVQPNSRSRSRRMSSPPTPAPR